MNSKGLIYGGAALMLASINAWATVPTLGIMSTNANDIAISVTNLSAGATYYIEHTTTLASNDWYEVHSFEGFEGHTNWTTEASDSGFYRAVRETYHPKVGEIADFGTGNAHDVAGTAHIVNNNTIELRNFHFDGGGVRIEVWLSESGNFPSDYISISDNLLGMVFEDDTLTLDIPTGTDLSKINYISIWCIPFGASFGDGQFQ